MVVEQHFVVGGSISNSLTSARDVAPLQTLEPADPLFSFAFVPFDFFRPTFVSFVSLFLSLVRSSFLWSRRCAKEA
jgi:hypothetical protein